MNVNDYTDFDYVLDETLDPFVTKLAQVEGLPNDLVQTFAKHWANVDGRLNERKEQAKLAAIVLVLANRMQEWEYVNKNKLSWAAFESDDAIGAYSVIPETYKSQAKNIYNALVDIRERAWNTVPAVG